MATYDRLQNEEISFQTDEHPTPRGHPPTGTSRLEYLGQFTSTLDNSESSLNSQCKLFYCDKVKSNFHIRWLKELNQTQVNPPRGPTEIHG